jgi:hypothetical protein
MASRLLYFLVIAYLAMVFGIRTTYLAMDFGIRTTYLAMDFKMVGELALDVWEWWQICLLNVWPCLHI